MFTSRFSGLISLCTMFMLCRYFRAPARLYTMMLASLSVYLAEEVMASNKSPPCADGRQSGIASKACTGGHWHKSWPVLLPWRAPSPGTAQMVCPPPRSAWWCWGALPSAALPLRFQWGAPGKHTTHTASLLQCTTAHRIYSEPLCSGKKKKKRKQLCWLNLNWCQGCVIQSDSSCACESVKIIWVKR